LSKAGQFEIFGYANCFLIFFSAGKRKHQNEKILILWFKEHVTLSPKEDKQFLIGQFSRIDYSVFLVTLLNESKQC
jgi:hypothetical protein